LLKGRLLRGKGLQRGKELPKENCQRGIAKEGLIELVGSLRGQCESARIIVGSHEPQSDKAVAI
jgi:hypothetical protein